MKQLTINAFTFDELSDKAKDKAREWMRNNGISLDEWWDSTYEDAKQAGIKIEGFDLGRAQSIDGKVDQPETTAHYITKNHGEHCETYKTAAAYLKERDAVIAAARKDENGDWLDENELDANLDNVDEEFTRSILEDYRIILDKEHEYRLSDEAIDEDIQANEYLFTENGSRSVTLNQPA
jgi:hypothetical protein